MQIDHAEDALVLLLHPHPVPDGTQIVAEMQGVGRLDAGEDAAFHGGGPRGCLLRGRPYRRLWLESQGNCRRGAVVRVIERYGLTPWFLLILLRSDPIL